MEKKESVTGVGLLSTRIRTAHRELAGSTDPEPSPIMDDKSGAEVQVGVEKEQADTLLAVMNRGRKVDSRTGSGLGSPSAVATFHSRSRD